MVHKQLSNGNRTKCNLNFPARESNHIVNIKGLALLWIELSGNRPTCFFLSTPTRLFIVTETVSARLK